MKTKFNKFIIGGVIVAGLTIGTILYKLDDIRREIRYRNLWK